MFPLTSRTLRASALVRGLAAVLLLLAGLVVASSPAHARVSGTAPTLFEEFRVFGDSVSVGNTLMQSQPSQPLVNSLLLSSSTARVSGIPVGAEIEGAYLFWSGSTDIDLGVDRSVTFETADGSSRTVTADRCFEASATLAPGPDGEVDYFYCRADVADIVRTNPNGTSFNGIYELGNMNAEAGVLDAAGECVNPFCQAFYGGWSLVLVWSSDTATTLRDVAIYDGFRLLDETPASAAIDNFTISGFDVADPPEATYRFFAMEGDALLGVPPQDTDPVFRCDTCFDYIELNGERLSDPLNQPNNVFNSTIPEGVAIGIDIDSFDVSDRVSPGDTSVAIEVGSGDGNPLTGHDTGAGGGELFILGYNILTINRLAPNFRSRDTFVAVDPTEAAPGETLFYTVQLTNDGSLDANNVELSALLPANTEYVAGSTRLDGAVVADVGGLSPIFSGWSLGTIPSTGDNDLRITFRLRVAADTPNGTIIPFSARIDANELDTPTPTNEVEVTVVAPSLQTPQKTALDLNGGALEPGDFVTYTIRIRKDADRAAAGLTFVDDISAFAVLTSVNAGGFVDASDLDGGVNGTGQVRIEDISLPVGLESSTFSFTVRIKTPAELAAVGVDPGDIDGLVIPNQGRLEADFLPAALLTDDPSTAPSPDSTDLTLTSAVDFSNAATFKSLEDRNGGLLEPGDPIRFTISLRNAGNQDASVNLADDLPAGIVGASVASAPAGVTLLPAPAGANATGALEALGLDVGADETVTIRIDATVDPAATGGTVIQNIAQLEVIGFPEQDRSLTSESLTVVAGPGFSDTTKVAAGGAGGFQPNELVAWTIRFTNDGNEDAVDVVVTDVVDGNLTAIAPLDGGVYSPGTRTIRWSIGSVAVGETREVRFESRIAVGVADGTSISNQASVEASTGGAFLSDDPATAAADDPTVIRVESLPALRLEKVAVDSNGGLWEPGDSVRYVFRLFNDGRAAATDVTVIDPVPVGLEDVVPGAGGALDGGSVLWDSGTTPALASVPAGGSVALSFTARIPLDAENGESFSNQAQAAGVPDVTAISDDPATAAAEDPTVIVVAAEARLDTSTKTVEDLNSGAFQPGDRVRYSITVINSGTGVARDLVVRDPLPANLIDAVALDGGLVDGGEVVWTPAAALLPGDELTLRFEATIVGGLPNGTIISNQATISSPDVATDTLTDDPATGAAGDPTSFEVVSRPDFATSTKAVERVGGGAEFFPGDAVRYELVIENTGTATATDVVVNDALDPNLGDFTLSGGGVVAGGEARWTIPSLAPGEGVTLFLDATIAFPLGDGTIITNQATIVADDTPDTVTDDPSTAVEDDATVFTVTSRPDLSTTFKTFRELDGDGIVRPGDRIEYTIVVTNSGSEPAVDVVVEDLLDSNLVDVDPGDAVLDAGRLTWSRLTTPELASIGVGDANAVTLQFFATVTSPIANATRIDNQAQLFVGAETFVSDDPTTAEESDPTAFLVISSFDLSTSTKTIDPPGSGLFRPGDRVVYRIVVENTGTDVARNVVVTDAVAAELSIVSTTPAAELTPPSIRWSAATAPELAEIGVGESVELLVTADLASVIEDGTVVANQAFASATGGADSFPTDDPATAAVDDATAFEVTSAPSLSTSTKVVEDLDADGFFEPGDEVAYTITVRNTGDDVARDVVVEDRLPLDALTAVTVLDGGTFDGTTARWTSAGTPGLAALAIGDAVELRVVARIRDDAANAQLVQNQADLTPDSGVTDVTDDPASAAPGDPTSFTVTAAARLDGLQKSVVDLNGGELEPGDVVRYEVLVQNEGTQPAQGVVVRDPVPAGLEDVAPLDGGVFDGAVVAWSIGDLAPGAALTVRFEARVRAETPDGTVISNQATASAFDLADVVSDDPTTDANDDPTELVVRSRPDLSSATKIIEDLDGGDLRPGDRVLYRFTLANTGFGPAEQVTVGDVLNLDVLTDVVVGQGGRLVGNAVTWDAASTPALASIAGGAVVELTLEATIAADVTNGTVLSNQATITAPEGVFELTDDPSTPEVDDPTVVVFAFPTLDAATKSVLDLDGGTFEPGDIVQYTIRIPAEGVALNRVGVQDPIDPRLTDVIGVTPITFDEALGVVFVGPDTDPRLTRIEPGQTVEIVFQATIAEDAPQGTVIENQAVLVSEEVSDGALSDDPTTDAPDDSTSFVVEGATRAVLDTSTKTVFDLNGGFVAPGDVLRYEIAIVNSGVGATSGLTFVDPVPTRTSLVPGSVSVAGVSVDANAEVLAAGLAVGELAAGEELLVAFNVVVDDDAPDGARVSNQAVLAEDGGAVARTDDPSTSAIDDPTTVIVGDVPDLARSIKSVVSADENGDGVPQVGETLTYTIEVANRGAAVAEMVELIDPVPANTAYVAGTLRSRGISLSDAVGDDAGEVIEGEVRVRIGNLVPGDSVEVRFEVIPVEGDLVANQAMFTWDGGMAASDDDGDPTNGVNPTVIALGDLDGRARADKRVVDNNGGTLEPGDAVTYTVVVRAAGDVRAPFVIRDEPDAGIEGLVPRLVPAGVEVTAVPGALELRFDALDDGDERVVVFDAAVAGDVSDGEVLCNRLVSDVFESTPEPACGTVGGRLGVSGLSGRLFRENGTRNGVFDAETDAPVEGFVVQLLDTETGAVIATDEADQDGGWEAQALDEGTYALEVYGGDPELGGALFSREELTVASGQELARDLLVDPSGVVYASETREPVGGARVFLYYDRGLGGEPDPADLVVDEDLASPTQQGQRVPDNGFYRFDARTNGQYRLVVEPGTVGLSFPSLQIPAEEEPIVADDRVDVVETGIPAEVPEGEERYFLRFDLQGEAAGVFQNHVPLDPLSDQIVLAKRADRVAARVGDIVTYTITVENRSDADLVYDSATEQGGIRIHDRLPRPFRLVSGSAVASLDGEALADTRRLDVEAVGERDLVFGATVDGEPEPFSLPAGSRLTLRYFVVLGSATEPGRRYRNTAVARQADTELAVSNVDEVVLRVDYDPIFDEGVLLGKVWCDDNGDGRQQRGELGLPGARVYLDSGYYADVDSDGQFHFSSIEPGMHLVKIDTNSLPPGSSLTTEEARAFHVTRGLPVGIDFGVACVSERVTDIDVLPGDAALAEAQRLRRARYVEVDADLTGGALALDGVDVPLLALGARFGAGAAEQAVVPFLGARTEPAAEPEGSGEGAAPVVPEPTPLEVVDLRADEDGTLVDPLVASVATSGAIERWVLEVRRMSDNRIVYVRNGREVPADGVVWDGSDDVGRMVLRPLGVYVARVRAVDQEGRLAESAPAVVRVARTRPNYLVDERFSDVTMTERRLDPDLEAGLRELAEELRDTAPAQIRIEAHLDDRDEVDDEQALTRAQAVAAARFLVNELGIERERIEPVGYGIERPIYPNVADRTRETNRRVDVRVVDPDPDITRPELGPLPTPAGRVVVNQRALAASDGQVRELVPRPADGLAAVTMERTDGSRQGTLVQTREGMQVDGVERPEWPEVPVVVDLLAGEVQVGDATRALAGSGARVEVNETVTRRNGMRLDPGLRFRGVDVPEGATWRFEILEPSGIAVWSETGEGAIPGEWRWTGRTSDGGPLAEGLHEARVVVRLADGGLVASAPARFELLSADAEPLGVDVDETPSVVRIDGTLVPVIDGRATATVRTGTGRSVLIDVQDAGRRIVPVPVPEGFEPMGRRAVDLSAFRLWVDVQDEESATVEPSLGPTQEVPEELERPEPPGEGDETDAVEAPQRTDETEPDATDQPADGDTNEPASEEPDDSEEAPASPFAPVTDARPWLQLPASSAPSIELDLVAQLDEDAPQTDESTEEPPPAWAELARTYEEQLAAALSLDADAEWAAIARDAEAGQIDVHLPPEGVPIPAPRLPVYGTTVPTNRVFVNGAEVAVSDDGSFSTTVELPAGPSEILVETEDLDGNRGRLTWPVEVRNSSLFMLAIADTAVGTRGASFDGLHAHNSRRTDGGALLYGQARMYFKGWVSGAEILDGQWDDIDITAHVDTSARRDFRSFVDETIEPDRDYPVFGDGSEMVADVNSRGKVYVLIEADESSATWGNFNTEIRGIEVLRYERNLYGAQVALDEVIADDFRTELQIHVADEEDQVAQGYDFLRGTGGSIYYLSERPLVEGSERVSLIVRDRISGVELDRVPLARNADYSMRYNEGRIITKAPIPSVVDDTFIVGNSSTTRSLLRGHPVFLEVTYDHEGVRGAGELSYGVHARETFYDLVSLGGTVIDEQRGAGDSYRLWGVEAGVGPTETTRFDIEYASSRSDDLQYAYSDDGGLTFGSFRLDDTEDEDGNALFMRGRFEIADVIESERTRIWNVEAYFQDVDRGYFANGTILDQGEEKIGIASRWNVTDNHSLALRHDRVLTEVDDLNTDDLEDTARVERQLTMAQYAYQLGPGSFTLAYQHAFVDDARVDDGYQNDILTAGIGARVLPWLRLGVEQELVIRGEDPRLLRGADGPSDTRIEDRFITTVSAGLRIVEGLELTASERFRYSGENATQLGLRARWADQSTVYVQQRFESRADNRGHQTTTVVGGEDRHGEDGSGRTYGEYHLDNGTSGQRTRAVLGFGKRWTIIDELSLDVGYERSETLTSTSPDSNTSRDTFSMGWELRTDEFQASSLFEARLDQGASVGVANGGCLGDDIAGNPYYCRDRVTSVGNRRQFASLLSAQWQITRDTAWFARFDYVVTDNRTLDLLESRDVEGTLGFAWRPVAYDTVDVLGRYTFLGEQAPYQLELDQRREERSHVFSIAPIIELPWNLQLVEKVAYRNIQLDVEGMPRVNNDLWLFINRLNYHVMSTVDVGFEYRFLRQSLTDDWRHGVLLEAAYILKDHVRLGLGYNFTRFTEDELGDFDRDASGVFFRVTAQY